MDFRDFKTGPNDINRRLDKVIRIFIPDTPLAAIYKSLRKGLIKVNSNKVKQDYKIKEGDLIQIAAFLLEEKAVEENQNKKPAALQSSASLSLNPAWIVFENEHILIINKPAGISVHSAAPGQISLQALVQAYYNSSRKNTSLSFKPGPLHRIDKYTRGLVCFSMSIKGAQWFSQNLREHKIKKTYQAILQGLISSQEKWQDRIEETDKNGPQFHTVKVKALDAAGTESGKECITNVYPVKSYKKGDFDLTLANIEIQTGRHHQIRAQAAFHGHPLYGDTAYGGHKNPDKETPFYLVAWKIAFPKNELGLPPEIELKTLPPLL
ncbi:MAG: RluA family pseudouridine synthase [Treponema sp.]|nr:RluA family pseudouridine synthase [Treponema sp.]